MGQLTLIQGLESPMPKKQMANVLIYNETISDVENGKLISRYAWTSKQYCEVMELGNSDTQSLHVKRYYAIIVQCTHLYKIQIFTVFNI
jgi:hypothetical protein